MNWFPLNLGLSSKPKPPHSSLSGYLWKMKRTPKILTPQWTRRFFSIEGRRLRWYEHEGAEVERGSVDLRSITGVSRFEPGNKGVHSFILCCPERNLLLRANGLADMEKWIRGIQTQADRARGGTGMGVITGLFPSMGSRRGKQKPLPTLEKELDRIVQRLNFLENEIVLNADDIDVNEKDRRAKAEAADENSMLSVATPLSSATTAAAAAAAAGSVVGRGEPLRSRSFGRPKQPEEFPSRLAALVAEDCDSAEDSEPNSSDSSPAFVRQVREPSRAVTASASASRNHGWTREV